MAYSVEVVKRARARLAQAKADRESENQQHLAEAYQKLPRLREKLCEKACETGAITVTDNLATIDNAKCTACGACVEKCPKKIIHLLGEES